ncbi:MAG: Epoxyqueuosine reductase [Thermodesulfobacteriota bacterium]|nr:Epoxyqueuosine reductase [Thermodesulfobacteriota bacterium]
MESEKELLDSAMAWGADYSGIADLSPARNAVLEQGGAEIAGYPRSISVGIALFHPIVNQLSRNIERAAAVSYKSHCYDIINARLDQIVSRLASLLQRGGHRAFPVPASKRVDDDKICAGFSHKLSAHMAGLGWIGKNCLLITPDMGPRVRWATVLTDAPLTASGKSMDERCGDCRECVDICPVKAFTGESFRQEEPRSARFDASKCDRYFSKMKKKDAETAVCGLCLFTCPYGRR